MIRLLREKFGIEWHYISSNKFIEMLKTYIKKVELSEIKSHAKNIVNLSDDDLEMALKIYYLLKELIRKKNADVLTINCLFSNILQEIRATPCYAFSRLNDEGIPAICEADVTTLLNMIITVYASESPGFMANPYLFPDGDHLLLSHCTSPTLRNFKSSERDEFTLYSHFESKMGVGVKVLKRENSIVTITGISHDKMDEMIIIVGKIVKNTRLSTCRTQIVVEAPMRKKYWKTIREDIG